MKIATLIVATLAAPIVIAGAALAQGTGAGPVGQSCKDDIAKLCAGIPHGQGKVRACLQDNKSKVSEACRSALDNTGPGRGMGGMGMGGMGGRKGM